MHDAVEVADEVDHRQHTDSAIHEDGERHQVLDDVPDAGNEDQARHEEAIDRHAERERHGHERDLCVGADGLLIGLGLLPLPELAQVPDQQVEVREEERDEPGVAEDDRDLVANLAGVPRGGDALDGGHRGLWVRGQVHEVHEEQDRHAAEPKGSKKIQRGVPLAHVANHGVASLLEVSVSIPRGVLGQDNTRL